MQQNPERNDSNESRTRYNCSWSCFLMPPHPSANFEIQKYYENQPKSKGIYSGNNLPKVKDWAFEINPNMNQ